MATESYMLKRFGFWREQKNGRGGRKACIQDNQKHMQRVSQHERKAILGAKKKQHWKINAHRKRDRLRRKYLHLCSSDKEMKINSLAIKDQTTWKCMTVKPSRIRQYGNVWLSNHQGSGNMETYGCQTIKDWTTGKRYGCQPPRIRWKWKSMHSICISH